MVGSWSCIGYKIFLTYACLVMADRLASIWTSKHSTWCIRRTDTFRAAGISSHVCTCIWDNCLNALHNTVSLGIRTHTLSYSDRSHPISTRCLVSDQLKVNGFSSVNHERINSNGVYIAAINRDNVHFVTINRYLKWVFYSCWCDAEPRLLTFSDLEQGQGVRKVIPAPSTIHQGSVILNNSHVIVVQDEVSVLDINNHFSCTRLLSCYRVLVIICNRWMVQPVIDSNHKLWRDWYDGVYDQHPV